MAFNAPGAVRLRKFSVDGQDIYKSVREAKMFESLMRPFQVSEALILDNENLTNLKGWQGGEPIEIVFDTPHGSSYETKMKLHSIGNLHNLPSMRTQAYKFNIVGESFFNNISSKIQFPFQNISGARAIEKLHNTYLKPKDASLSITDSKGFIGEKVPYIVSNQYAFDAISDIRGRLTHDKYKTGAYTYYRDKDGYKLTPLEKLFAEIDVIEQFENTPTVGANFSDIGKQFRNIFQFSMGTSFNPAGKNSPSGMQMAGKNVITNQTHAGETYVKGQIKTPSPGTVSGTPQYTQYDQGGNPYGRMIRNVLNDPKLNKFSPVAEKIDQEQLYGRMVQDGPSCTVSVFPELGFNCTVGKGIYANISAPSGMGNQTTDNSLKGNYVIVNLVHSLRFYDCPVMAHSKFELARGGFNK